MRALLVIIMLLYFTSVAFLISCAPLYPKRDFEVELWGAFSEDQTIARKTDEGFYMEIKTSHPAFDQFICMLPEDYQKEREYQERLIKSCKEWR